MLSRGFTRKKPLDDHWFILYLIDVLEKGRMNLKDVKTVEDFLNLISPEVDKEARSTALDLVEEDPGFALMVCKSVLNELHSFVSSGIELDIEDGDLEFLPQWYLMKKNLQDSMQSLQNVNL